MQKIEIDHIYPLRSFLASGMRDDTFQGSGLPCW